MKTENIFDKLENESTISDSTLIENTGVSTERVLDMVKQEIGSTGKVIHFGKKRRTAIKITALIAAVLTASVITASALDGFNSAFGSLFAGDSPDGLYSGGDLEIESNENTSVEFLGIAGDDYIVASAMKLRNNDGTAYIAEEDVENSWIAPASTDNTADYLFGAFPDTIEYTTPTWFKIKNSFFVNDEGKRDDVISTFGFYFDDSSTISAYIYSSSSLGAFKGETLTASADSFSVYTIEKVVYDYSEHLEENYIDEYGFKMSKDFNEALTHELQTFGTGEKDGVRIMVHPETNDIVLARESPLDISFSISVKMNYKNSSVKLDMKDLDKCFDKWSAGASGSMTVTPFNASFSVKLDEEMVHTYDEPGDVISGWEDFVEYVDYMEDTATNPEMLTFTLEDGTIVTAYDEGLLGYGDASKTNFTVLYQFFNYNGDGSRLHPIAIDPNKIASVEANGTVIYEK